MAKNAKGGSAGKGSSLFAGIVLGMILGLAAAGGVAWYVLKKNPTSFESKEHHEVVKPALENKTLVAPPVVVSAPMAATSGVEPKQHFEFYKVLTDKPDAASQQNRDKPTVAAKETRAVPAVQQPSASAKEIYYIQAGSFPSTEDAEKLKAKLALLGMEASLQTAEIPNKGTYHRVRLGPFKGSEEMNNAMATLKQNGVANATAIKAQ